MSTLTQTIKAVKSGDGSLLDAMLAVQDIDGYLTEQALEEIAQAYGMPLTQLYETATFYSMLRFAPVGKIVIQVCRNAPCHVAGAGETVAAFEQALGIPIGGTTKDSAFTLEYTECIGQCQASPSVLVNGALHTGVTADKVPALLKALA